MSAQHTPGPWAVGHLSLSVTAPCATPPGGSHKVCDIRGWGYLTGTGHGALGLSDEEARSIQEANANLIAAAPDLLTQLVGAVALAEHIIASLDIDAETTTLRVRANGENIADIPISTLIANQRAAIAKAEGRS